MERGIYFDGWYKNNHCYHPGLPYRSMQMVEDLEAFHGTVLVWSILGGGSISLPYLEHEAFGEVDPRLRFYGFMNDSEFIAECKKRGIKPFGIVFEVQGWEFPAKISENGKSFELLNVDRDEQCDQWYGLREFTQDKHVGIFGKSFADYFPDGLFNSDGEAVTDIWDECCSRDYNGAPVHTEWVEVKNHAHQAYQMCRNNPVWRAYMKKIIEIQIDAGVSGVQLDECELPMTSIRYGGCFCKDCMKQFNEYMSGLKASGLLAPEYADIDFDNFNYGDYLRSQGLAYPGNINDLPMYKHYIDYQYRAVKKHFSEMAAHIRAYGKSVGRDVLVSGNFFNILPVYYPLRPDVDMIITEQQQTILREVAWFRYVAGFAGDKDVVIVENPYGGSVTDLVGKLDRGESYDIFLQLMMEGNVYGCNMSVPYGSWMGNVEKDSFWPPRELTMAIQDYVYQNESLFSKKSGARVLLLYGFSSNYWLEAQSGYSSNSILDGDDDSVLSYGRQDDDDPNSIRLAFWDVARRLSEHQVNYDVKFIGDGELHEDDISENWFEEYDLVILPECSQLTQKQADLLKQAVSEDNKKLFLFGSNGTNIAGWENSIKQLSGVYHCDNDKVKKAAMKNFDEAFVPLLPAINNVSVSSPDVNFGVHILEDKIAVHFINYAYDDQLDKTIPVDEMDIILRDNLAVYDQVEVKTIFAESGIIIENVSREDSDNSLKIKVKNVPTYFAIVLSK